MKDLLISKVYKREYFSVHRQNVNKKGSYIIPDLRT